MSRTCQSVPGEPQPARYRWSAASSSISSSSQTRLASFKSGPFERKHLPGGTPEISNNIKLSTYQLAVATQSCHQVIRGQKRPGSHPAAGDQQPSRARMTNATAPPATAVAISQESASSKFSISRGDRRKAGKAEGRSCPRISAPAAPAETESRFASRPLAQAKSRPDPTPWRPPSYSRDRQLAPDSAVANRPDVGREPNRSRRVLRTHTAPGQEQSRSEG
jgi:hypothetical protein